MDTPNKDVSEPKTSILLSTQQIDSIKKTLKRLIGNKIELQSFDTLFEKKRMVYSIPYGGWYLNIDTSNDKTVINATLSGRMGGMVKCVIDSNGIILKKEYDGY